MTRTSTIFTAAVAAFCLTAAAHAASITDNDATWPTDNNAGESVDVYSVADGNAALTTAEFDTKDDRVNGQSFEATKSGTIERIYFSAFGGGDSFTINVFEVSDIDDPIVTQGAQVGSEITVDAFTPSGKGENYEVTLTALEQFSVTAGQGYLILIEDADNSGTAFKWSHILDDGNDEPTPNFSPGVPVRNGSKHSRPEFDFGVAWAVPEPASLALLGLGGLFLMPRRRK